MDIKGLYEKISEHSFNMRRGIANSVNHAAFIEQMKNVLFNNLDDIEAALKLASEMEKQINVLEVELNDAERELSEKDKTIAELTSKRTTSKKKNAGALNE